MIFSSTIDNQTASRWGINVEDAYLFTWIYSLPVWADRSVIDGKDFYHGSRNSVHKALPLASDKSDTIYRQLKRLQSAGIIEHEKVGLKDFIHITPKGREWNLIQTSEKDPTLGSNDQASEKNPDKLGKKSESGSEKNPTYYNYNKEHYNNSDKEEGADAPHAPKIEGIEDLPLNGQKQKVEARGGGGAKVKKEAETFDEAYPDLDDFADAWNRSGHVKTHPTIDPQKLGYKVRNWGRNGTAKKPNIPVEKLDWLAQAANFLTEKEYKIYQYDHIATDSVGNQKLRENAARLAASTGGDLKSMWANLPPRKQ